MVSTPSGVLTTVPMVTAVSQVSITDAIVAALALVVVVALGIGSRLVASVQLMKAANDEYRAEIKELREGRIQDRKECEVQLAEVRGQVDLLRGQMQSLRGLVAEDIASHVVSKLKEST